MVIEIIEKHGGFIELKSTQDQGSVFAIRWQNELQIAGRN
jgi:signal transduction histidine kinase